MKGQFTEVRFDATINKGNYESEKIGVTYAMAEGEDVFEAISTCKNVVYGNNTTVTKTTASVTETKAEKKSVVKEKKETPKAEEKKVEEKVEEKAEEVKTEEKKEEKKKTVVKAKNTPYDRTKEEHKRLLSSFLDKAVPNWKSKEVVSKASAASSKLTEEKADFLDGDGNILDSFKQAFMSLLEK